MRKPLSFSDDEPEVNEARAQQAIDRMLEMRSTHGWQQVLEYVAHEIEARQGFLEKSAKDDDRHRGALEILRAIQRYPESVIQIADAEIRKYRGN